MTCTIAESSVWFGVGVPTAATSGSFAIRALMSSRAWMKSLFCVTSARITSGPLRPGPNSFAVRS